MSENYCWRLRVSDDNRFLVKADSSSWFWLGDTAWDLFTRLNREELHEYFRNRQEKGFTVIQGVVLMGYHVDFNTPNIYGHRPFIDDDPTRPDTRGGENFWTHADYIIDTASQYEIYIGILPTWGDHVAGYGRPVRLNKENAQVYAEWLVNRYKTRPNVIWINGGDVKGDENGEKDVEIWNTIGETIKRVDPDHLVTFHPRGGRSSSRLFHNESWLDFNMIQSGHSHLNRHNDDQIDADYRLTPVKPTLDGEPRYESHPVNWKPINGYFIDFDERQAAYWSLFAGAFGHTYGHVNMWRFNVPGVDQAKEHFQMMDLHWRQVMDFPGAFQMTYVRSLMLSRPQKGRIPYQELLIDNPEQGARMRACLGDGYAFIYTPYGMPIKIKLSALSWSDYSCWWYDPRTGAASSIDSKIGSKSHSFAPPGRPYRGNDWILVIDDGAKNYPPPGVVK